MSPGKPGGWQQREHDRLSSMVLSAIICSVFLLVSSVITRRRNRREVLRGLEQFRRRGRRCLLPILMPVYGRPHYLRQTLEALSRARDIGKTVLIISQDGADDQVSALIRGIDFTEVIHLRHTRPFLGVPTYFWDSLYAVSDNIHFLLDFALRGLESEGAIVLEDDLVVSPDFFNYFEWTFGHVLADARVLSVTGFNLHSRICPESRHHPEEHPFDLIENRENGRSKFTGWSWMINRRQWARIREHWSFFSWDIGLDATQRKLNLVSYKPVLGRVRNIGMQGGINFTESDGDPRWADVTIPERAIEYEAPPRILGEAPVVPPVSAFAPARSGSNERSRTRRHRRWLCLAIAALACAEFLIYFRKR
jgi:GNT-I family